MVRKNRIRRKNKEEGRIVPLVQQMEKTEHHTPGDSGNLLKTQ